MSTSLLYPLHLNTSSSPPPIESIVGHEYFHNYTGNRVTCRDWFQLTLKEGLTVLRDQQFSADSIGNLPTCPNTILPPKASLLTTHAITILITIGHGLQRIHDVKALKSKQFPEDAGPTAHSIRPDSYMSPDNFYTPTGNLIPYLECHISITSTDPFL